MVLVNELSFERRPQALRHGVVIGISDGPHGLDDAELVAEESVLERSDPLTPMRVGPAPRKLAAQRHAVKRRGYSGGCGGRGRSAVKGGPEMAGQNGSREAAGDNWTGRGRGIQAALPVRTVSAGWRRAGC